MKLLLYIFLLLLSYATQAQELSLDTTRFVGGDSTCGYSDATYSIPTKDGGILFVGFTDCFAGGGDIPSSPPDTSAESNPSNILIGKLDSNMNVSWIKIYGGSWEDIAVSAVQTNDGGYAILSYTFSNNRDVSGNHAFGAGDFWLARIDTLGNLLWQKCYGSPYDEQPGSIALAPDNGFIIFGNSNGFGGDVPLHYGTDFNYNWFIIKTDSVGNKQWTKTIGGTAGGSDGGESGYGSAFYADGGYYFASSTNSTDYDCTDTAWHVGVNTGYDYYVYKLDTAGNILWDSSYGGSQSDMVYNAVWDNRDSSIVINGQTFSYDYMVTGYNGGGDMWAAKVDRNGKMKWGKCLGSPNNEMGTSIICTNAGYLAYRSTFVGSIGEQDAWLFSIDTLGNEITNTQFGGTGYEWIQSSVVPFKNGYAASGFTNSDSFTNGINVGHPPELIADVFISSFNYWPLMVSSVNNSGLQITVFPNPTQKLLRIMLPGQGTITIINCNGAKMCNELIVKNENYIDINTTDWTDGMYIVKWQGEDGSVLTNKFIRN